MVFVKSMAKGFAAALLACILAACANGLAGEEEPQDPFDVAATAGQQVATSADGVTFNMVCIPGGLVFPIGSWDSSTRTVADAYFIGETEVTYELWQKVYAWAATDSGGGKRADGGALYHFANAGIQGDNGSRGVQHPVTTVNWRDSIVWCNALTEWYNARKGTSYDCAYAYSGAVLRDSRDGNAAACDGAEAASGAKGFRLPMIYEWELAARYRDGTLWTCGDHASGDDSGACSGNSTTVGDMGQSTVFGGYAVYEGNSSNTTAAVKSKLPNALGLYDICGNVWEWCFDSSNNHLERYVRGGSYSHRAAMMQVGYFLMSTPDSVGAPMGFRFAKTW